tara:strand:+ start:1123 stop:1512 length:390 start_codon:yes stop_codon:yes gene_type:complete
MAVKDDDKKKKAEAKAKMARDVAANRARKEAGKKTEAEKAAADAAKMAKDVAANRAAREENKNAKEIYAGYGSTVAKQGTPMRAKQDKEQNRKRTEGVANENTRQASIDRIKKEEESTFKKGVSGKFNY